MSYRGRGRGGRGGRGRGDSYDARRGKHETYELFPKDVKLPPKPVLEQSSEDEMQVIFRKKRLENYWRSSPYNLRVAAPKSKKEDEDIDCFWDKSKIKKGTKPEDLADYLILTTSNFPSELVQGSKRVQHVPKNLQWGRDSDQLLNFFEKLEENSKGLDKNDPKEKKGESEDEEEAEEEVEAESSDDDDYKQNIDFDDDEDDLNMAEEADEDIL